MKLIERGVVMKVNMKGLINQLDDLRERLNELFDKLKELEDLDYDIAVEDVQQYILPGDTFNLTIAMSVLEQADKLDKALEIIKRIVKIVDYSDHTIANGNLIILQGGEIKTKEEYNLIKEVLL